MIDLPERKNIRIQGYDYSQNNAYFITICTQDRRRVFGEIENAQLKPATNQPHKIIIKWLEKIAEKFALASISDFVVMPDHVHFILLNPGLHDEENGTHQGVALEEIVKWFKTQTTNEYIKGVKTGLYPRFDKHLWQRNYYEHIIRSKEDYANLAKYIFENPLKWEFEKS